MKRKREISPIFDIEMTKEKKNKSFLSRKQLMFLKNNNTMPPANQREFRCRMKKERFEVMSALIEGFVGFLCKFSEWTDERWEATNEKILPCVKIQGQMFEVKIRRIFEEPEFNLDVFVNMILYRIYTYYHCHNTKKKKKKEYDPEFDKAWEFEDIMEDLDIVFAPRIFTLDEREWICEEVYRRMGWHKVRQTYHLEKEKMEKFFEEFRYPESKI